MKDSNLNNKLQASEKIKKINRKTVLKGSLIVVALFIALKMLGLFLIFLGGNMVSNQIINNPTKKIQTSIPSPTLPPRPKSKILSNGGYHIFQSFNNCGPAALSMALRFYNINVSQETLGEALRPYQVPSGDNDDKSVTLQEVAQKSKEFGLIPFLRPMGNDEIIKRFIANDIPVITRTWTKPNEDIGHFRVIKGYDDNRGVFIQDDSLQGHDLEYTYADFDEIWKKFNYEYLVLIPKEKQQIAEQIIGEDLNEKIAWDKAKNNSLNELKSNPTSIDDRFNLSVVYFHLNEYQNSINEFEKIESNLSSRTLWYQIEPIESYFKLGNDQKVFELTDKILNNQNRAFSELYILRGKIYQKQGDLNASKIEYEKAIQYNKNLNEAKELLNNI